MTTKEIYDLYKSLGYDWDATIIAISYDFPDMIPEEIGESLSDAIFEYGDI